MRQNATDDELPLGPDQDLVLNALMAGMSASSAATQAGVHRSTVHRWLKDPHFLGEYNRRRSEQSAALRERLALLESKALDTLDQAIVAGDSRLALAVLRGSGLLDGKARTVGSDDPRRLAAGAAAAEKELLLDELLSR